MLFLIKRKYTINRSDVGVFWGVHSAFVSDFRVTPNGIVGRDGCLGANAILLIFRSTWRLDLYTNDTVICNRVLFSYKSKRYRYKTKSIITYPSNFVPLPDVGFVRVIWGQRWMDASAGATNGHQHYHQQLEIYIPAKIEMLG
jgi:hypothetical protein